MATSKLLLIVIPLVPLGTACGPNITCEDRVTCPPGSGSATGAAGEGGSVGGTAASAGGDTTLSGGPSSSTSEGAGGTHSPSASATGGGDGGGGAGSLGGAGGSPPCAGACEGETPVCDPETNTCVECLENTQCKAGVCDPEAHTCVECLADKDCDAGVCDRGTQQCVECLTENDCPEGAPHCDPDHFCVECLASAQCTGALEARCDAGSCSPCQSNADCAHLPGMTVCDASAGECVECTGTDYASCGVNDDDEPLVCDSQTRTCTDQVEHGAGLCTPCVADAECPLGELCVLQSFDDQEVGYFCFWREGDTEHGAPETCGSASRPYFEQIANVTSIDGQLATICGLDVSTCVARNQFRKKACAPEGTPDHSLCGVAPPADAVCAEASATEHFCTMTCRNDFDCPLGGPCIDNVGIPYCEL